LEGPGVGVAFDATPEGLHALVLQSGVDYLYQLDLYTGRAHELALAAPPKAIEALPEGGFGISHAVATGLLSFYDPVAGTLEEASGFAVHGLLEGVRLVEEE